MDLLLTGEANLRRGCMSILRNLVLQNLQCFNEFFKTEGFVSEIIADVASRDLNLQRFAIEIVKGYLDTGTDSILQAFYEADSMPALLVPLETANSNREIAGICFKILQKFESKIHAGKNPWVRVWAEWKAQDDQRRAELREKRKAARELKKQRREEKQAAEGKDSSGGKSPKRKPKGGGPSKGNLKSKSSAKPKKSTPKKGPKPKAPPTTTPRSPKSRS
ncbi:uncharacterized protein BJ171DRAFT_517424, partial [Polychytrium aggregatum]|uniref:uncharacterized protein n=1 Tax=Polychytrium aggregatum TaxID=110093 RepID=UPI0022FE4204